MMPCRESARLIAISYERRLSLVERVQLYWHLRACDLCRRYRQQMAVINLALSKKSNIVTSEELLSDEARERIQKQLDLDSSPMDGTL